MPIEFINQNNHQVVLTGPDKKIIILQKNERRVLPEYFMAYVPRYLKVLGTVSGPTKSQSDRKVPLIIGKSTPIPPAPPKRKNPVTMRPDFKFKSAHTLRTNRRPGSRATLPVRTIEYFKEVVDRLKYPISNDIGVGILSFNRINSIKRLVDSIRKYTDLYQTTVFISDESSDDEVKKYLSTINDMTVIQNNVRLGVAGNTNRLMRCLARFKHKIILNDDVEVFKLGWDSLYVNAMKNSGYHHFCLYQAGLYNDALRGYVKSVNGVMVRTIPDKPLGAVIAFDDVAFNKVGYFDEDFGLYGMEHVDWSSRVSASGIQPHGIHDVEDSGKYFYIHKDKSAVENWSNLRAESKKILANKESARRIYVNTTDKTRLPGISCVIPYRGINRAHAIEIIMNNMKAQRFPIVDIVMIEQDNATRVNLPNPSTYTYALVHNRSQNDPFVKAMAFNAGVSLSKFKHIVLQDADIMVQSNYFKIVDNLLCNHNGIHIGKNVLYLDEKSTNNVYNSRILLKSNIIDRAVGYFEGGSLGCTKDAYINIGGFNERFIGWGNEDTEFFYRLSHYPKFYDIRSEDFIHLYHERGAGWKNNYGVNTKLENQCKLRQYDKYCSELKEELFKRHPKFL